MITYDNLGRMDRASIIEYIRRNLASLRPISVDPYSGHENPQAPLVNAAFSTEELQVRVNSSLTKAFLLINMDNKMVFKKSQYYDVTRDDVRYPFPSDMAQLLDIKWKSAGISATQARVDDYRSIARVEISNPTDFQPAIGRPSWRWEGTSFMLNSPPSDFQSGATNFAGIWLTYVPWIRPLLDDSDVLPMPYAPILQEVIAYDAAVDCVRTKEFFVDISSLERNLAYWNQQLQVLVRNAYSPGEVQLVSKRPYIANSWTSRSSGRTWRRG